MASKKELRNEIRMRKKNYSEIQLREFSRDITRKLLELSHIKEARTIALYSSLPDEVYTFDIIHILNDTGKKILLPAVTGDEDMELREYNSDEDLREGSFGIMEPCGSHVTAYSDIDVVVVPGMAFDKNGNRLGRGKGYYDRFLEKVDNAYKIGICFPFQLLEAVPADAHDIKMDIVIS